jgi:hypothetical protein
MKQHRVNRPVVTAAFVVSLASSACAELWLDAYVAGSVLIVKARDVAGPDSHGVSTFEVLETWKGTFDPAAFAPGVAKGTSLRARQGEHGVRSVRGQEIVLFYTRDNQPDEKLHRHSTALPITDGRIVYAATNADLREEMPVEAFEKRVTANAAAAGAPATKLSIAGQG